MGIELRRKNLIKYASIISAFIMVSIPSFANALSISSSYSSSQNIEAGYLVSLNSNQTVSLSNVNNSSNLLGVSIKKNTSNISYNSVSPSLEVGTNGIYQLYVSNINGEINAGDRISPSIVDGVGQKASLPGRVIGVAQSSFNPSSTGTVKRYVNSQHPNIYFGQITVNVFVSDFSGIQISTSTNNLVSKFQNFSSKVLNKKINQNNALMGLVILSVGMIIALFMLAFSLISTVKNIGRNPLAKTEILRYFLLIMLMVLAIIIISIFTSYLVVTG
jgi:hypothetical protein